MQTTTELWPIPVQLLALTARELEQRGISTTCLLEGSGVSERVLFEPDRLLPYRTTQRILERAIKLCPDTGLGLALGAQHSPSGMGMLGYGLNCCATAADALDMTLKYHRISSTLLQSELRQEGESRYWVSTPPVDLGVLLPCVVEEEFSSLCQVFNVLTGESIDLLSIYFQYPEPENIAEYRRVFNCPLYFSSAENKVSINPQQLQLPILQANPLSLAAAERMCIEFLEANPAVSDLVMQVRQLILEKQNQFLSEAAVAERMNITSRTLRNRLQKLGTSYQVILDDLREQIAKTDLINSTFNIGAIAERLDYSDARSFRRAFKKWTGLTPDDFRKRYSVTGRKTLFLARG